MSSADIVYYNANIISSNSENLSYDSEELATFNDSRLTPIIDNMSDYEMSIVRFSLNGLKTLPIWMPSIQTGQSDPNLTTYAIRMTVVFEYTNPTTTNPFNATITTTQPILWTPEDSRAKQANPPLTTIDMTSNYYFGYTYQHFCDLFNTCVANCFVDIKLQLATALTAAGENPLTVLMTTKQPFLNWNETNQLFYFHTDVYSSGGSYATSLSTTKKETLTVGFDNDLYGLLGSFPFSTTSDNYYNVEVVNTKNNVLVPLSLTTGQPDSSLGVFFITKQNYTTTSILWCPIDSICFTSSLLGAEHEYVGNTVKYGTTNTKTQSSSQNYQAIITDFSVYMQSADSYVEFISYNPTAEYKMMSLSKNNQPLLNIDLQLYWRNRLTNELIPIRLFNQTSISIKIMFRRKPVYDNY